MKKISIILISLLITFSYEGTTIALTDCEIKNDDTTKTKAVVSCLASATLADYVFVDNYLKLKGKTETSKTASLASCAAATCETESGGKFPCTFTCSKVTSEEKDVAYILTEIAPADASGVFSGTHSGDVVTLAVKASSNSVYTGQAAAAANEDTNNAQKKDDNSDSSTFIKYTLLLLNILLF